MFLIQDTRLARCLAECVRMADPHHRNDQGSTVAIVTYHGVSQE
jgi:hypothetical protein